MTRLLIQTYTWEYYGYTLPLFTKVQGTWDLKTLAPLLCIRTIVTDVKMTVIDFTSSKFHQ